IRQLVSFTVHDLLKDRYERDLDLILCRNVTIYLTEETKRRIYRQFYDSLRPGCYLFVGGTEMILRPAEIGFKPVLLDFYRKPPAGSVSAR
ncbi:MAG: chemotaxis protein CheR, partial [Chloroflexota bacterium]|nr:chemotaxis protein CheR [Chloroflexota bacterium]